MAHSSANSVLQRELLDTIKGLRTTVESLQATIEDLRKALAESQERKLNWKLIVRQKKNFPMKPNRKKRKKRKRNGSLVHCGRNCLKA